jgi:hypothetical protein
MWWAGSYSNTGGIFAVNNQALSAGNHTLTIYGLEGCCDGGQQVQYAVNGGAFQSFNNSSLQLAAAVPEPETYAMLLGGLAWLARLRVVAANSRLKRAPKNSPAGIAAGGAEN